jgi:DNA invertase Pin-like site-specific DNA recombinase
MVAVWAVDRLGRSLTDLLNTLQTLKQSKVGLFLHEQGIDTSTAAGNAFFQMLGVFAEFERAIIVERVTSTAVTAAPALGGDRMAAVRSLFLASTSATRAARRCATSLAD